MRAYRAAFGTGLLLLGGCLAAGFAQVGRESHSLPGLSRDPFVAGSAALARGDRAVAAREYRVGAAVNVYDFDVQLAAADGLLAAGDLEAVLEVLARAEGLRPGHPSTQIANAWALRLAGRSAEAFAAFAVALDRDPANVRALSGLGEVLLDRSQNADAALVLGRAVTIDPRRASLRDALGVALAGAGRPGEAAGQFEVALALEPTPGRRANLARARAEVRQGGAP